MKVPLTLITIGISCGIGTIALFVVTYTKNKRKQNTFKNEKWQRVGTIKEIDLYPVKSSSAVSVEEAECNEFGLMSCGIDDRRLIIINENDGKIATTGRYPSMLKIHIEIHSNGVLKMSSSNEKSIFVNLNDMKSHNGPKILMKMKGYNLNLTECLTIHHDWVSRVVLQKQNGLRLYLAAVPKIDRSFWRTITNDSIPIMAVHDKSVEELNSKIASDSSICHLQFRGNLLIQSVDDVPAFDEDKWLWLKIGENAESCTILRYDSPCLRCIVINIDVLTCERSIDFEPLKTLRSSRLRSHPKEPEMGVYFNVIKTGKIKCGDSVFVQ